MPNTPALLAASRSSAVVVFAAVGQLLGGVAALGWAYRYADWLGAGGVDALLTLVTLGLLGCGLALLPTHVLSLLCGWAFGVYAGFGVAILVVTAAAPLGYFCGRALAGPGINTLIQRYPRGSAVCEAITHASPMRAAFLVGLLRLSPVVPYASTNVLAAIFDIRIRPFIAGTFVGLAPRVFMVVLIGAGLEKLTSNQGVSSPWMLWLGIAATLAAFLLIAWAGRRALAQIAGDVQPNPAG